MKDIRPYLIRAMIDWIVDSGNTPHLVVDCAVQGVNVPAEYATDGKLVLNVSPYATRNLDVDDEVHVDCRFRGQSVHIGVPVGSIVAVYAKETQMGMTFDPEDAETEPPPSPRPKAPSLKLVK